VSEEVAEQGQSGRSERDPWLALITVLLLGAGLVMVLSASSALAYVQNLSPLHYFDRQLVFAGLGLAGMIAASRVDYHRWRQWAPMGAAVVLLLMLVVLVPGIGIKVNGARRWFNLGPLGTFQPSEVAKLVFAVFLAHWLEKRGERITVMADGLLPFGIMLAAVLAILTLQKDLGSALIMATIFVTIFFIGGGRLRDLALLLLIMVLVFALLTVFESYRSARLKVFLNPFLDPLGSGYQISQALVGLGSGGLTGVGLGHSVQKYLWLPEAHTDFIFAIVGEETGLIGTTMMLAGFVMLALRGFRAAFRAPDHFGVMLGAAITAWISIQALLNMATVTDTLPITGVPLPLISYGGTSIAITLTAIGILLNISGQGRRRGYPRRRSDATLDSRRWNGRPPASGARRRASIPRG